MPHVNIKHFPVPLTDGQKTKLSAAITEAIVATMGCASAVVSIALEPINKEMWNERVYIPEIQRRKELLCKTPNY